MVQQSAKYEEIGNEVRKELFPKLEGVKIAWLASDKEKKANGKTIFGECAKVPEKFQWCCPYDFTITVYEPNITHFDDKQLRILLEHELMHVGSEEGNLSIIPHDIEEFSKIIKKYGSAWALDKEHDWNFEDIDSKIKSICD